MCSELGCCTNLYEEADKEYFARTTIENIELNNNCEKCIAKDVEGKCSGRGCEESEKL